MNRLLAWRKEPGVRVTGSRGLDRFKVQAPGVVALPGGCYRLFYTAVGPDKPFAHCQGCILSATSDDGLTFEVEPGIRVAPDPGRPELSLRALAPSVTPIAGGWRMYFEGRGSADRPTVIASAVSADLLRWEVEPGVRVAASERCGAPRFLPLGGGAGRLFHFRTAAGPPRWNAVYSAVTEDGLSFTREAGVRMASRTGALDSSGITAAEVVAPPRPDVPWVMIYSAWQDVPPGTAVPLHPSEDPDAVARGGSADFAAASIAVDLCGYRSRILAATSPDGLHFGPGSVVVEGGGYDSDDIDAVHAEDMTLVRLPDGRCRMYYASCDAAGNWQIASAITA